MQTIIFTSHASSLASISHTYIRELMKRGRLAKRNGLRTSS